MKLQELIENLEYEKLINFKDVEITGISYNSKVTKENDIFVCIVGEQSDGHVFAKDAIQNGAVALLVEKELPELDVVQIVVSSTRQKIADIADKFYASPSKILNLIGVTGTNGKTTVTHLIQKILEQNDEKCALIGTLGTKLTSHDAYTDAKHTTPQAPELQATFKRIKEEYKIDNVVMEVSSHALDLGRVKNCDFNGAVITNLTQDHLDYHITMDNYFDAKAILFRNLQEGCFAVVNADDLYADRFLDVVSSGVRKFTYGIKNDADIMAKDIKFSLSGAEFILDIKTHSTSQPLNFSTKINLHMNGMFSVYNVLAAITSALALGIDIKVAINALENVKGVAGRFEVVVKEPLVIVDYAHTPDGLENVLKSAREITPQDGKLICLFGCGGDRDATKRPKMGAIAERLADKIVITSDNPRTEDPQIIITDIIAGLKSINTENVIVESDRGSAIALLKTIASKEDVILIAGKGHEDYQILKDKTIHFDDREEAKKVFEGALL